MKERKTGIGRRKFYIAYGSNLDMDQMRRRCPTARPYYPYCSGWLNNWELIYRGSKSGNYATIRKAKGKYVPVGVWLITREDERALDKYEGYPVFYQKYKLPVALQSGETIEGIVYIMRPDAAVGAPTERYVDTIYRGYGDFDLDYRYLMDSLILNLNELKKERPQSLSFPVNAVAAASRSCVSPGVCASRTDGHSVREQSVRRDRNPVLRRSGRGARD